MTSSKRAVFEDNTVVSIINVSNLTFVGREALLRRLDAIIDDIRATGAGRLVSVRGRRRVGKSRLIEEWLRRGGVPHVFFAASRQGPERELALFAETVERSGIGAPPGVRFETWEAALSYVAGSALAAQSAAGGNDGTGGPWPVVVVLDEFPYLLERQPELEGTVQKLWDTLIQRRPMALVLIGSDITMMTALTEYGRPLYGRTTELVIPPFTPSETAAMGGLDGAAALEAYLVAGGFPLVVRSWRRGETLWQFLTRELADPTSPLIVTGERMLAAEFPSEVQARDVLRVIGHGERTFNAIGQTAGIPQMSLKRSLDTLVERKRVVAALQPRSAKPSRETRYVVADPYLRFWLRFIGPALDEIERGRVDLVMQRIRDSWPTYRGRAIEPLVREAVERLLPDERFGDAQYVGGYWTRTNDVEVDLTGTRERQGAKRVSFVGSIKWKERAPFDRQDLAALAAHHALVPGSDEATRLVAVSRSGSTVAGLDVTLSPADLLAAWR